MIKLTDSSGNLFPAVRNLLNLVWLTVGISIGWFAHMNWTMRAESDQLVQDATEMVEIRKETREAENILKENIDNAKTIPDTTECNCGNATDIEFVRELRKDRETRFQLDGRLPFQLHTRNGDK